MARIDNKIKKNLPLCLTLVLGCGNFSHRLVAVPAGNVMRATEVETTKSNHFTIW